MGQMRNAYKGLGQSEGQLHERFKRRYYDKEKDPK